MEKKVLRHRKSGLQYLESVSEIKLKFRDYLDMKELYRQIHDWLCEEEFGDWVDNNFPEIFYLHKFTQKTGEEVRFLWRLEKQVTSYYKYQIDVDVLVLFLKTSEMVKEGKKFKVNYGEPEIKIFSRLVTDHKGEWRKHPILKHFQDLFWKRIFKHDLDMHKIELYRISYRLAEAIKTYFKGRVFLPEREGQNFTLQNDYVQ